MDFQSLTEALSSPTCVMSVERKGDGGYGDIRVVAANAKYARLLKVRMRPNVPKKEGDDGSFVPGRIYTDYFQQNINFEDVCYRAAILKKEVHTYAHIPNVDVWFDIYAMPLDFEDGKNSYCLYSAIANNNADAVIDSFSTSKTASDVLKTCIRLHRASNLKEAMESVISEIRLICKAAGCTVLLLNNEEEEFSILATDYVPDNRIKRVTEFEGFYAIANSWIDMLGEEGDCIIIRNNEEMEEVGRINHPWYLTLVEAGVKSVVLFPLRQGSELLGFIWAINFDTENTTHIKETLELTTFFISSHIARFKVVKRLERMSYTDALTGLPNRFACSEHITDLIGKGEKFSVFSIDLNNFKRINDTLGFEAGNRVLVEVAERWKAVSETCTEGEDLYLTRLGGDEFFLVMSGYETEEELKRLISCYVSVLGDPLTIDGCDLYVSACFGYAEYPSDADTTDLLISHANAAMNGIKKSSSGEHIMRYSSELCIEEHVLEVENVIRIALENDTIFFNLQPQYDMEHKLRGFEALARMKDGDGNFVSPGEFIPVAEKVGLIDRVDGTVFLKAAMFFGQLLRETGAKLTLSVNASVRHLMRNDFTEEIRDLLRKSGVPAGQLEIEITESIMIDSVDKALNCIDELKNMGIKIAIDDFGTGYSSLSYLNRFPVNLLKIDKSFIDKMNTSESSRQYVAAIISIGHVMGFDVISEGVEEQEQLETLKDIGCDFIQGFIWGRPLSAEDASKLVLSSFEKNKSC